MTLVELLIAFNRLPPQMWDVIHPHGPRIERLVGRSSADFVSLNGQPTQPADPHLVAADLARDVVFAGSIAEMIGANGAEVMQRLIDDWCGTGWPHWPFPGPIGPYGGEPHPDWSAATGQLVGAFALAATAARMSPGSLRDAVELGANQLLDVAQR